jgi:hypothetical protein
VRTRRSRQAAVIALAQPFPGRADVAGSAHGPSTEPARQFAGAAALLIVDNHALQETRSRSAIPHTA